MIEFVLVLSIIIYAITLLLIFNDDCIGFHFNINNFTMPILLFVPTELVVLYGIASNNFFVVVAGGIMGCVVVYRIADCIRVGVALIRSA